MWQDLTVDLYILFPLLSMFYIKYFFILGFILMFPPPSPPAFLPLSPLPPLHWPSHVIKIFPSSFSVSSIHSLTFHSSTSRHVIIHHTNHPRYLLIHLSLLPSLLPHPLFRFLLTSFTPSLLHFNSLTSRSSLFPFSFFFLFILHCCGSFLPSLFSPAQYLLHHIFLPSPFLHPSLIKVLRFLPSFLHNLLSLPSLSSPQSPSRIIHSSPPSLFPSLSKVRRFRPSFLTFTYQIHTSSFLSYSFFHSSLTLFSFSLPKSFLYSFLSRHFWRICYPFPLSVRQLV